MITRSNLADQLREYQLRSKHDWAFVSFFASTSNLTTSRPTNDRILEPVHRDCKIHSKKWHSHCCMRFKEVTVPLVIMLHIASVVTKHGDDS
ncbi:hypothetical protein F383_19348 [Gossypium arboreum]|uniref:Uncharacterized protein n=1 Tax=Gossypium arboreum TaxID=29729 RepID=A0A0B0NG98_GOSAR|nr:hypothetical protein F383_19348 [Gossypium arboreum]